MARFHPSNLPINQPADGLISCSVAERDKAAKVLVAGSGPKDPFHPRWFLMSRS